MLTVHAAIVDSITKTYLTRSKDPICTQARPKASWSPKRSEKKRLGPQRGPFGRPRAAQEQLQAAQERTKSEPEHPKRSSEQPKGHPRAAKSSPRAMTSGPRAAQERSRAAQEHPTNVLRRFWKAKMIQSGTRNGSKFETIFKCEQKSSLRASWSCLGPILARSCARVGNKNKPKVLENVIFREKLRF